MRSLPIPLAIAAVIVALTLFGGGDSPLTAPPLAEAIEVEPVVWQLDRDYPSSIATDGALPISNVYIKTHDGSDWMSTYDDHPRAISGPASIRALIADYAAQGVEVSAWFVPQGTDFTRQVQMAVEVIDSGVKALYADLEPFQGFCYLDCRALAENFWYEVREQRPNAHLGVIYDPRPWWWNQSATAQWFSVADSALPMCYWETFSGQVPWGDPAGCVSQAHRDLKALAPGRHLEYVPMLQGDSDTVRFQQALDAAVVAGSTRVSVWRRGVVSNDIWNLVANFQELDGPRCEDTPLDGCLIREATNGTIHVLYGGTAFPIPSPQVFDGLGLNWRRVQVVPTGFVNGFAKVPKDGTLLREYNNTGIWVVFAGAKFLVPDPGQFAALGYLEANVRVVPPGGVASIPLVPEELVRLTELSNPQEYIIVQGGRLTLDAGILSVLAAAGNPANRRYQLPDGGLSQIPVTVLERGDADCSGSIDNIDAIHLLRYGSSLRPLGICTHLSGDADCDGAPAAADALPVLRFLADEDPAQPAGCSPIGEQVVPYVPPTPEPTVSPTAEPSAGATATATPVDSSSPTATTTPVATASATGSPTLTPTPAAVTPTVIESASPTVSSSPSP